MATTNVLTWQKNPETDVAKYNIYRKVGSAPVKGPADLYASVPSPTVTYADFVSTDGDFFYAVTAVDTANLESPLSNVVDKVVNANPPQAPVGLVVV